MIQYSVMTFMFEPWWKDGRLSHEAMIEGFGRLGIQGVEPFHTFFAQDPALAGRYAKALAANGMKVSAVDVLCDLVYSTAQEKRQGRDNLRRGLDICAALGAEVAHVAGHMPKAAVALPDARQMIADGLAAEAGFARQHGLTLAIEDFGFTPTLMCAAEDCLDVMTRSGGVVKLVFDTGNFEFAGEHADTNFDALYGHACYVHFKDWRRAHDRKPGDTDIGNKEFFGCPLGEGIVPNAQVARLLRARKYSGWVALEAGAVTDPLGTVRRDLATLKNWLGN